jgi:hypothetical protein
MDFSCGINDEYGRFEGESAFQKGGKWGQETTRFFRKVL